MEVSCASCTFLNAASATQCEMCKQSFASDTALPQEHKAPNPGEKRLHCVEESLTCLKCTFNNYITALACEVCGHTLDEQSIPPIAPKKPRTPSHATYSCKDKISCDSSNSSEVVQNGLILLLEDALEEQHADSRIQQHKKRRLQPSHPSYFKLCSPLVPHVTQRGVQEGVHWSCGYRNIQMMFYCLQRMRTSCLRDCSKRDGGGIFGSGDVPDVAGLQIWIEKAWQAGFDHMGAEQFGGSLFGTDEWIGATECAALLRYLGFRAQIVDFHTKKLSKSQKGTGSTAQLEAEETPSTSPVVRWVKDYFDMRHPFLQSPLPAAYAGCECSANANISSSASASTSSTSSSTQQGCVNANGEQAQSSTLPPLYFQHQGHSRTIVGYEQTSTKFSLLLFDPSSSGRKLRLKLEQREGWQMMMKRSAHTLTQGQFQIVYISPGELLKTDSLEYASGRELSSTVYR